MSLSFSSNNFTSSISLNSLWWSSWSSVDCWSNFNYSWVNSATDTVLHFKIKFWNDVELESSVFLQIFFGWLINNISDGKSFDSLVFRAVSSAIDTYNSSYIPSVVFVSTVISSLLWHLWLIFNLIYYKKNWININADYILREKVIFKKVYDKHKNNKNEKIK